jgi:hypothetical protein
MRTPRSSRLINAAKLTRGRAMEKGRRPRRYAAGAIAALRFKIVLE